MAIVPDKSGNVPWIDPPLTTYNRTMAGTPNGVFTPEFVGEIVWDSTNKVRWRAVNLLNTGWRSLDVEVT